jgi:hypothetical protein
MFEKPFTPTLPAALAALTALAACQTQPASSAGANDTPQACEARKQSLVELLGRLPAQSLGTDFRTEIPGSTLGAAPGAGPVLEVTETARFLDGEPLDDAGWSARAKTFASGTTVYVAAAPDVTIRALRAAVLPLPSHANLKLLVRVRSPAALPAEQGTPARAQELATSVLTERNAKTRVATAERGYTEFARCPALASGVATAGRTHANARWPALRAELARAVPECACDSFDAGALRALVTAEYRAGTASLGAVPLGFVRDERCEASMGLRSVKRLLEQMERFDADYAGKISDDAVRFEEIITSDRLLVEFCDALPGETLATLQRKKATLYWRVAGSNECQAWTFAPLAPGAPMGTWKRAASAAAPATAYHYWQAAEEISVFGPVTSDPPSKPTDQKTWECRFSYKLTGIDEDSIALENGRWFFSEAKCRAASETAAPGGCPVEPGGC